MEKQGLYIPIPELFHSFLAEGPFEHCLICNLYLLDNGVSYLIEKAYKGTEVIVEYALCVACAKNMYQELSQESMQRVVAYVEERIDYHDRMLRLLDINGSGEKMYEDMIRECMLTRIPRQDCDDFHICGQFVGDQLKIGVLPYVISGKAMAEIQPLLSKQTRDRMDDFIDDYLGLGPEFRDVVDDMPLLIL